MQKSRRQPQSNVPIRRFCKRKSYCHVIAIPHAGIAASTVTVMQGFQAKKDCSMHFLPISKCCVYTPYTSIPRVCNPSVNRTLLRWLEGKRVNRYTTPIAAMHCQNAVFKPNV